MVSGQRADCDCLMVDARSNLPHSVSPVYLEEIENAGKASVFYLGPLGPR